MLGIHDFGLFLCAAVLLNLTPGPDTVYILGRSIAHGRSAGVASALGICVGTIFHTLAASFGLSAFLATSAWAFSAVKLDLPARHRPAHGERRAVSGPEGPL